MVSILTKESFENKEIIETNYKNKWKNNNDVITNTKLCLYSHIPIVPKGTIGIWL